MANTNTSILIVEKLGAVKEYTVKQFVETELFKKAGFKTADGFACRTEWKLPDGTVSVYGKITGRAGNENKYEFPPPIDTLLFFGNCVIVRKRGDQVVSISSKEWQSIYETLYGGFEDIDNSDEDDDEDAEDDEIDPAKRTKSGYLKDNFVVDDEDPLDTEEEETEEEDKPKRVFPKGKVKQKVETVVARKTPVRNKKRSIASVVPETSVSAPNIYKDCIDELTEEEYIE